MGSSPVARVATLCALLTSGGLAVAGTDELSLAEFNRYFQIIGVESQHIVLRMAAGPLTHPTGDGRGEIIRAGDSVVLPLGVGTKFFARHSGILFTPLPPPFATDGFSVNGYVDLTSMGAPNENRKALLVRTVGAAGKLSQLRWLPPDTGPAEIAAVINGEHSYGEAIRIEAGVVALRTPKTSEVPKPSAAANFDTPAPYSKAVCDAKRLPRWTIMGLLTAAIAIVLAIFLKALRK